LNTEPYISGLIKTNLYAKKSDITGCLTVVLDGKFENRGLSIIAQTSRCVIKNHVHELIITDEEPAPGDTVNRIAYIGFIVLDTSGVIVRGDSLYIRDNYIGDIAGFDETHMPNHLNIVIKGSSRVSGLELGLELSDSLIIKSN
jgi:hypothetical protein